MLTTDDVVQYTSGRLEDDDETARLLAAAYAIARGYCGWHVTPEQTDEITVDGPGRPMLMLPTLKLVELIEVVEDGVTLNIADLEWSSIGQVRKKRAMTSVWPLRNWWSPHYNAITVTMTHGYEVLPDFDQAVLELVDRMSSAAGSTVGASGPLVTKKVQEVMYQWAPPTTAAGARGMLNTSILDSYLLVPIA